MPGPHSAFRGRLFKAVHAEAAKRDMDHDALRDLCHRSYGVRFMSEMTDADLLKLYRSFTGKSLKRKAQLPRRGELDEAGERLISGEELVALDAEFARRALGPEARQNFVRRQLKGRDEIRTRSDFVRVWNGIRAMNRRDGV
jgi:hypothetical protein